MSWRTTQKKKWIKRKQEDIDYLSEWVKAMSANATSVFKDPDVAKTLSTIHDKYAVPADKAGNNIAFVCKTYYIKCLLLEVDIAVIRLILPLHSPKKRYIVLGRDSS